MFKKLKNIFISGLLGLGLVYGVGCGEDTTVSYKNKIENTNNKPIITNSLENASAGEYYAQKIQTYDSDGDNLTLSLISGPSGMTLENGILKFSPRYSKINSSQTGTLSIKLSVSDGIDTTFKTLELVVTEEPKLENINNPTPLDYLRTNENIRPVCEAPCVNPNNILEKVREDELDKKSNGVFNAIKVTRETVQADTVPEMKPVDYHLLKDSECLGDMTYLFYTSDGRYLICNKKNILPGDYIEISNNPLITSHEDIRANSAPIHEYVHAILNGKPANIGWDGKFFQESVASSIAAVITDQSGYYPDTNSFCDLGNTACTYENGIKCITYPPGINFPENYYKFLTYNLCSYYGFDIKDLPEMFEKLRVSTDTSVQNVKCIIDSIVSNNLGVQTNTWDAFYDSNISVENNYCE